LRPITRFLDGGNSRSLCRLFDGGTNALIGAAAANVCGHRRVDINVAGLELVASSAAADMIWPDWQ
jgi:hypothetical protein